MKLSWINCGVAINVICIGLYIFVTKTDGWGYFFNIVSYLVNVFLCCVVFKAVSSGLTNKELSGVLFMGIYKSLCIAYLLMCIIFIKPDEMFEDVSFIVFVAVAGGLAWFMSKPIYGKLYEK